MKKQILLVDDDTVLLKTLQRMFKLFDVTVEPLERAGEAIDLVREDPDRFPVALIDLTMPDMNGEELIEALHRLAPKMEIFLISGYGEGNRVQSAVSKGASGFLAKPFRMNTIQDFVQRVFVEA
ncbi:response regulator [bacterium]|nr:response regulator [bacterium]